MQILLTGATGKVGQHFLDAFLRDSRWADATLVALCHNRTVNEDDRVSMVRGSISDKAVVAEAMKGVTHVVHMSAVKEDPDLAMDISVKGLFWLLEEFRQSPTAEQFILIGGDCSVGHIFHEYDGPVTEHAPRRAYPGCYALSKVLEETMLEQYFVQYDLNGCCLRAPWIMEKDDFKYVMSFGDDQFGGPLWDELIPANDIAAHHKSNKMPLLMDRNEKPLRRNFVHVSDLISAVLCALDNPAARQQTFNIAMNRPVDYAEVAAHMEKSRGQKSVTIPSQFHSNWLDNNKARLQLEWEPQYDLQKLIEEAYTYQRADNDPRKIWYAG